MCIESPFSEIIDRIQRRQHYGDKLTVTSDPVYLVAAAVECCKFCFVHEINRLRHGDSYVYTTGFKNCLHNAFRRIKFVLSTGKQSIISGNIINLYSFCVGGGLCLL